MESTHLLEYKTLSGYTINIKSKHKGTDIDARRFGNLCASKTHISQIKIRIKENMQGNTR